MDGVRHITGRAIVCQLGQWRTGTGGVAYAELADRIRLLVLDGRLPTQTRLPAERELAAALRVSRTTVAAGYDLLRETGFVHSRRGAGSWTRLPHAPGGRSVTPFAPSGDPVALDLAYTAPAAPPEAFAAALRAAAELAPGHGTGTGYQLLGLDSLRDTVAARFTHRGLPTGREHIMITCGAQQAIAAVLAALVAPGERVLVEHPTFPNALDAIAREHARAVPVGFAGPEWDPEWDLAAMAASVRDVQPRLIYLIPDHQNPTGHRMSAAQRAEVTALARRTRTPLLIDETMAELALDGPAAPPLAAQASGDSSPPLITVGSASKVLWGGLRIGWVRAVPSMIERVARARASMDISTSVLDQLVTQHLLADLDTVLAERLPALRSARDHLLTMVARHFPSWRSSKPPGGLSLWVDLGRPASSALVAASAQHGVLLAAGPRFGVDGAFERRLRLPYTLAEPTLELAVRRVASAWASLPDAGLPASGSPAWPAPPIAMV